MASRVLSLHFGVSSVSPPVFKIGLFQLRYIFGFFIFLGGGQMAECSQPVVFVLLFMNMVHPSY